MGFFENKLWTSSLQAELHAIRTGLSLARSHGFTHLVAETDSEVAIELLKINQNEKYTFFIDDCRSLMESFQHIH